jgi:hypothetical protein
VPASVFIRVDLSLDRSNRPAWGHPAHGPWGRATVSESFQYDPSAHDGVGHLDPHVTAYINSRLSSGASCRTSRCT